MMQCEFCHNIDGPFAIIEYKHKKRLVCEDCEEAIKKGEGEFRNDTTYLRNKRYASRIPRTNMRNK